LGDFILFFFVLSRALTSLSQIVLFVFVPVEGHRAFSFASTTRPASSITRGRKSAGSLQYTCTCLLASHVAEEHTSADVVCGGRRLRVLRLGRAQRQRRLLLLKLRCVGKLLLLL
jgi:hypothetical protein